MTDMTTLDSTQFLTAVKLGFSQFEHFQATFSITVCCNTAHAKDKTNSDNRISGVLLFSNIKAIVSAVH